MTALRDAALALAGAGLRVFPCRPRAKEPAVAGGFHAATSDIAQVTAWWDAMPEANIGIACAASGLLVLDVDPRNGGRESLPGLEAELGPLADTAVVVSGRGDGGAHLYYRLPAGANRWPREIAPGIDVKVNGYVLAPPSVHPDTGLPYRWVVDRPPAELPAPWIGRLQTAAPADITIGPHEAADAPTFPPATPEVLAAARAALAAHGPAVQGQHGDAHTYHAAAILVVDYALRPDEALALLAEWNLTCQPPWDPADLRVKVRNAAGYARGDYAASRRALALEAVIGGALVGTGGAGGALPFSAPAGDAGAAPEAGVPGGPPVPAPSADFTAEILQAARDLAAARAGAPSTGPPTPYEFVSATELLRRDMAAARWLVRGLLPENAVGVIGGMPKTTKTWLALEIEMSIATDTPAAGEFQPMGGRRQVAHFSAEDSSRSLRNRARALRPAGTNLDLVHFSCRQSLDLLNDVDLARIVATCRRLPHPPALLVLDPLRDIQSGDENDSSAMAEVMHRLRAMRDVLRCSVLVVHHSGKPSADSSRRRGLERLRGSSAIAGAVDCGLFFDDLDTDGRSFWSSKIDVVIRDARGAGEFRLDLQVVDDENDEAVEARWSVSRGAAPRANATGGREDREVDLIVRAMVAAGGRSTVTGLRDTIREVSGTGRGMRFQRMSQILEELRSRGWASIDGDAWVLDPALLAARRAEAAARPVGRQ